MSGNARVDFGPARRASRLAGGRISALRNLRAAAVVWAALLITAIAFVVSVGTGAFPIAPAELAAILLGRGEPFPSTVVLEWRLPRAVAAAGFGAALGLSGAVFQSLTRNPLGSPDVIGVNAGAFSGALVAVLLFGGSRGLVIGFAAAGAALAALLVFGLAFRRGLSGFRFVMVGVAVGAALTALNSLAILRVETGKAVAVSAWGQGSLEHLRWPDALPGLAAAALAALLLFRFAPALGQLELGDDTATALGTRVEPARLGLLACGVALTAAVTSVCGPIAFLALMAPQLARLLARSAGIPLAASAAVGAALLTGADLLAAGLFSAPLPVGIITTVAGGGYLIWLLARQGSRS